MGETPNAAFLQPGRRSRSRLGRAKAASYARSGLIDSCRTCKHHLRRWVGRRGASSPGRLPTVLRWMERHLVALCLQTNRIQLHLMICFFFFAETVLVSQDASTCCSRSFILSSTSSFFLLGFVFTFSIIVVTHGN